MAESPAGPRGFAERATSNGGMGDAPLAAEIEASRVALCSSSCKTPVRFRMTTSLGPGTGYAATGTPAAIGPALRQ